MHRFSLAAFRDGLKALGYVEGQNISIEYRWAEGNITRLPELATELVHEKVDIILAGGSVGAEAAKHATSVIPIIAAGVADLVEIGLVRSLARPGGNLTGFVANAPETAAKRFELMKEIKPHPDVWLFYGTPPVPVPNLNGRLRRHSLPQMILPSSFLMLATSSN
jgi:putative tryptophan/tyrosine transport system substrate-binding protein